MVWTQQSQWHLFFFCLSPYVESHYTGTLLCSTMVCITTSPQPHACQPSVSHKHQHQEKKRWMKVTPPSPQTATDSHYELECSQSCVMTGVCYTAAPSGHPYKALSIQRSPLSSADKCCYWVSGQGRVADWDDSEVCLGMPGSDWTAWVCVCVWSLPAALPPHASLLALTVVCFGHNKNKPDWPQNALEKHKHCNYWSKGYWCWNNGRLCVHFIIMHCLQFNKTAGLKNMLHAYACLYTQNLPWQPPHTQLYYICLR